jgi:hypothetical protein
VTSFLPQALRTALGGDTALQTPLSSVCSSHTTFASLASLISCPEWAQRILGHAMFDGVISILSIMIYLLFMFGPANQAIDPTDAKQGRGIKLLRLPLAMQSSGGLGRVGESTIPPRHLASLPSSQSKIYIGLGLACSLFAKLTLHALCMPAQPRLNSDISRKVFAKYSFISPISQLWAPKSQVARFPRPSNRSIRPFLPTSILPSRPCLESPAD